VVQAVKAMVQVQISMGLSQSKNELSLPSNFPEEWLVQDVTGTAAMSDLHLQLNTSILQNEVSHTLKAIRFDHVIEYMISMKDLADTYSIHVPRKDVDIFSIDIANVKEKIAIEVDGPFHFLLKMDNGRLMKHGQSGIANSMYEVNGSTMLKRRLLALMGWNVIVVPYWEWNAVQGNEQKERQYCVDLLQQNCNPT
jgi:RAP domain